MGGDRNAEPFGGPASRGRRAPLGHRHVAHHTDTHAIRVEPADAEQRLAEDQSEHHAVHRQDHGLGSGLHRPLGERIEEHADPDQLQCRSHCILDTYQRLKNEQSGNCLAEPGGGSSAAQQACASGGAEGWSYASVLSGILGAVSPDVELVNQRSGDCLSAGSGGQVSAAACSGGSGQTWQKTASGSGFEFRDEGTGQCLYASGGGVTAGSCGSSDAADLWTEDGTG